MSEPRGGLVVTYHAVEGSDSPLCIAPSLFEQQLETLATASAAVLTVSELAHRAREGTLPERAVALTFDDALASAATAAEALDRHGFRATVFPVTGHVGGQNDWATQPPGVPRRPLLDAGQLRSLAAAGWEIGSHGISHRPLGELDHAAVERELRDSREQLVELTGAPVTSFAFPYGSVPAGAAGLLADAGYASGLAARVGRVDGSSDPYALPRVDAHYLRRPFRLHDALLGPTAYLRLRGLGARLRRTVRADYR